MLCTDAGMILKAPIQNKLLLTITVTRQSICRHNDDKVCADNGPVYIYIYIYMNDACILEDKTRYSLCDPYHVVKVTSTYWYWRQLEL